MIRSSIIPVTGLGQLQEGFYWKNQKIVERFEGKERKIDCLNWHLPVSIIGRIYCLPPRFAE